MSGIAPVKPYRSAIDRIVTIGRRPGVGALLVLLAGGILPVPHRTADGAAHVIGIPTLCPFRLLTGGVPCPGCGMTRSVICLCHGRVGEALLYHPLGPPVVITLVIVAVYGLLSRRSFPDKIVTPAAFIGVSLLLIIWLARLLRWLPWPPA